MLCSCGDEEKIVHNYEKPIENLITAAEHSDTDSYLNCFTPQAKETYIADDEYNEKLAENVLEGGKLEGTDFETKSSEDLTADELSELEKEYKAKYKKTVTMKKGERLNVDFTALRGEKSVSDNLDIVVVRINDSWFIYGDVIEGFAFQTD